MHFLSIVTISFNQRKHLQTCLESVLSQKSQDIQYIVVDPGSTDGSRDLLENFRGAIDHLMLKSDIGPADGLNNGFSVATGQFGYFLNSDDFLLPGAVDRLRRHWKHNSSADLLLGGAWMVDIEGRPLRELGAIPVSLSSLLNGRATLVQQGMSFRMDAYRFVGGFNADNKTCWDYELLCSFLRHGLQIRVIDDRFGAFRMYGGSLSGGAQGHKHQMRYLADLDRINRTITGSSRKRSPSRLATQRICKFCMNPRAAYRVLRDRLFPALMYRRWFYDLNDVGGENKH